MRMCLNPIPLSIWCRLFSVCDDYKKDAKGRCPGDTGYIPIIKEAPVDFAAYAAAQKAKKEAEKAAKAAGKK